MGSYHEYTRAEIEIDEFDFDCDWGWEYAQEKAKKDEILSVLADYRRCCGILWHY
jgi:hypothetical protein